MSRQRWQAKEARQASGDMTPVSSTGTRSPKVAPVKVTRTTGEDVLKALGKLMANKPGG